MIKYRQQFYQQMMQKMLIITMQREYPFSEQDNKQTEPSVVVRQNIPTLPHNKYDLLSKATFMKNLRNQNLVRLESIQEKHSSIHLFYEYVHYKLPSDPSTRKSVAQQIYNLTIYLTNIGIKVTIEPQRIGINKNHMMKYFIGLDFQWENNQDQTALAHYYFQQLHQLDIYPQPSPVQELPLCLPPPKSMELEANPPRKISFATLPSRYNRLAQIDKQLTNIKSCSKEIPQGVSQIFKKMMNDPSEDKSRTLIRYPMVATENKKISMRKYSGDSGFDMMSKTRLFSKEKDSQSQIGRPRIRRFEQQKQEIQTVNSKTKIEKLKYQQYQEITKSNKNYLKDFISVLEDQDDQTNNIQPFDVQGKNFTYQNTAQTCKDAITLQNKAKEAVNNSLRAIKKFRTFTK